MPTDRQLLQLATRVGRRLLHARRRVATAESCTGGWVAKALTDVSGSSQWFECGYITYSNAAKVRDLGVSERVLRRHGAVSAETARAMARGALRVARVDIAVAITGIAGPDGGTLAKPVGTVWFGSAVRRSRTVRLAATRKRFAGDREAVRRKSVAYALRLIQQHLVARA
jgi:nicotinamide-nucleotide amidase